METEDEDGNVQGECAVVNIAEALMYSANNGAVTSNVLQMLLKQQRPNVEDAPKQTPKQKPGVAELMRDLDELDESPVQAEDDIDSDSEDVGHTESPYSLTDVFSKLRDKPVAPPPTSNIPPMPPPIVPVIIPNTQSSQSINGESSESK